MPTFSKPGLAWAFADPTAMRARKEELLMAGFPTDAETPDGRQSQRQDGSAGGSRAKEEDRNEAKNFGQNHDRCSFSLGLLNTSTEICRRR